MKTRSVTPGARIDTVDPRSDAWRRGIRPGDRIIRVDEQVVEDSLAATFALAAHVPQTIDIYREGAGPCSLEVPDPEGLLDDIRLEALTTLRCSNDCVYCFCKQNPPHARASLRFRDEDFRMSFLAGSYITLSSLSDDHLARILRDRLAPLYVTVPSTDEALRCMILGVGHARPLLPTLRTLVAAGITIHAQIVVCPGLNDGAVLDATLHDLSTLRPGLASVALVPVGTTRYTADPRIVRPESHDLRNLMAAARQWSMRGQRPWVLPSDEVYLALGRAVPATRSYGEAPQLATGVGMVRRFLDDFARVRRWHMPRWWRGRRIVIVSGTLFAPTLARCVTILNKRWGRSASVVSVVNRYFGSTVTVAGLLGGQEIVETVAALDADAVLVSSDVMGSHRSMFIDNTDVNTVRAGVGAPVVMGELLSDALRRLGALLG